MTDDEWVMARKPGRPRVVANPVRVEIVIDHTVLTVIDLEAEIHGTSRSELIRGIVGEWVANGGYSAAHPA